MGYIYNVQVPDSIISGIKLSSCIPKEIYYKITTNEIQSQFIICSTEESVQKMLLDQIKERKNTFKKENMLLNDIFLLVLSLTIYLCFKNQI